MDPYSKYNKQLDYYKYLEKQRDNYVGLAKENPENPNDSIKQFAQILFNKPINNLDQNLSGLLVDENMTTADIFCMLVELALYGINILTNEQTDIFSLKDSSDGMVNILKLYLKSCGFGIDVSEDFIDNDEINLYRDRTDYYCQITKRPPEFLCQPGWYVLGYRLINNKKFAFNNTTPLENFKTFFISANKKIFVINFKYMAHL